MMVGAAEEFSTTMSMSPSLSKSSKAAPATALFDCQTCARTLRYVGEGPIASVEQQKVGNLLRSSIVHQFDAIKMTAGDVDIAVAIVVEVDHARTPADMGQQRGGDARLAWMRNHDHVRAVGFGDRRSARARPWSGSRPCRLLCRRVATTAQDGRDFQAGAPDGSENASSAPGAASRHQARPARPAGRRRTSRGTWSGRSRTRPLSPAPSPVGYCTRDQRAFETLSFEAALDLAEALALVRGEGGDVDEPDDVRGIGGGVRDHRASVGVADRDDRPGNLTEKDATVGGVDARCRAAGSPVP